MEYHYSLNLKNKSYSKLKKIFCEMAKNMLFV